MKFLVTLDKTELIEALEKYLSERAGYIVKIDDHDIDWIPSIIELQISHSMGMQARPSPETVKPPTGKTAHEFTAAEAFANAKKQAGIPDAENEIKQVSQIPLADADRNDPNLPLPPRR